MTARAVRFAIIFLAACPAGTAPAGAILLSETNGEARLAGTFDKDDEKVFAEFLARPRAAPLRVLWLDSRGGAILPAIAIGLMTRKARLTTATRADAATCDSACTLVFAAGVRRHYVNGASVFEGLSSLSGLGFHGANIRGDAVRPTLASDKGTRLMNAYYKLMGMPGAGELAARAAINTVFRPSGATALRLRIATGLGEP